MITSILFSNNLRLTLLERFSRTLGWLHLNTCLGAGVAVTNLDRKPYPEVSGYLIPTLLKWGEHELASQYGRWLVSIQNSDGSWSDPAGEAPYTFDTGQILKGLLALSEKSQEYDDVIRRGCNWMLQQVQPDGRVTTPNTQHWLLPAGKVVPESIHLYALEPLRDAGRKWGVPAYEEAVERSLSYYLANPSLTRFDTLSHFHAYIVEALLDLGQLKAATKAMTEPADLQSRNGLIPGYSDSRWVCSTGLFQYAVIWYRLGDLSRADRAFNCASRLQNRSGGFFGSYGWGANYFKREEISWAQKYFLDALWWKIRSRFDNEANIFPEIISGGDGRYRLIEHVVRKVAPRSVLEAGCGKGRFLRRLLDDFPEIKLYGLDLSDKMISELPNKVEPLCGSLLNIPVSDGMFDLVFSVEALEHSVNISSAIRELSRVVAPGGTLVIIDKNRERLGSLEIAEWEQWFLPLEIASAMEQQGFTVHIEQNLSYDGHDGRDNLFLGWIATKK
ncbi:MAG: methyltransferase domain-containing protein [Geobacteraceae bacterium]|nr:methyltransferase domain-containing protein [Geobacteraceae bacterium]